MSDPRLMSIRLRSGRAAFFRRFAAGVGATRACGWNQIL